MPDRKCPFRLFEPHEIHPDDDYDWTITESMGDWDTEIDFRQVRNFMIKECLTKGDSLQYR